MTQNAEKVELVVEETFADVFKGKFYGVLRWHQLDVIWQKVKDDSEAGWYFYKVGETPPTDMIMGGKVITLIGELDVTLREQHKEEYCGIVYTDDLQSPSFIKVFDPGTLGTSCSIAKTPPLPDWVISKLPPEELIKEDSKSKYKKYWFM